MKIEILGFHGFTYCLVIVSIIVVWRADADEGGPPLPQTFRGMRPEWRTGANNTTKLMIGNETLSFHPTQEENSPFVVSQYSITCCRNGTPQPDPSLADYIHEWSQEMVGVERNKSCRRFNGYYSVPTWLMQQQKKLVVGVKCKCPDDGNLDRNCRYLPDCANGGYRSFSINLRCVCPPKWFGDLCEKFCLNGELYKDFATPSEDGLGVDRCKCMKNFFGEACDEVQCFNGGTPVKNRGCICLQPYIGPHCEEITGGILDSPPQSSFHRDLSSTVVSLFLAVALALGVYFLVRRRTQWMRRRMQARRAMMVGSGEDSGIPNTMSGAPPTYLRTLAATQRPPDAQGDVALYDITGLPPPPAYHDIVKIPPAYVDNRLHSANQESESAQGSAIDPNTGIPPGDTQEPPSSSSTLEEPVDGQQTSSHPGQPSAQPTSNTHDSGESEQTSETPRVHVHIV